MILASDVDFYNENGYLLVKGVFNKEEVEEMRTAVDRITDQAAKTK